jgi:ATP-dependent DNA helicase RecG
MPLSLSSPVEALTGVGPERAARLAQRGIRTVADLLHYLPFRYEDRRQITPVARLQPGGPFLVRASVVDASAVRHRGRAEVVLHVLVRDDSGTLRVRFFHGAYLQPRLRPGQTVMLYGRATVDPMRPAVLEMVNPQLELVGRDGRDSTESGRIVPVYQAIGPLSPRWLRRLIYQALAALPPQLEDPLPASLRQRLGLPDRATALRRAHFPDASASLDELNRFATPAQRRLIFEEFFLFQLGVALRRQQEHHRAGIAFRVRDDRIRQALKRILPFKPTAAQKRVLAEIAADMERPVPMNRLLQGDVGSGKTLVALEAAVIAIENGYQVALMAPTEILAAQHFLSARRTLAPGGYRVELLTSGLGRTARQQVLEHIAQGTAQLVVGTHALLEQPVRFARLGLVIIDEQHRFGVLQRKRLREKAAAPDVLVMTATPIPRTLALTLYGDLDLSVIDEMPPGRAPIRTLWYDEADLDTVWQLLRAEVRRGRQAYIVYPVIEESRLELKAAIAQYEQLSRTVFPDLRLGLLHGRMKNDDKDAVMEAFRRGELQVLVSTTVIEVGVDVPNATVMVIEHAERFGLAQLHQLRGRIGRGREPSTCILVAPRNATGEVRQRLETLVRTTSGHEIAEVDLRLRGPGEFFGTAQHGAPAFSIANPLRDFELLELARREAFALVEDATRAQELDQLREALGGAWAQRYELATVG